MSALLNLAVFKSIKLNIFQSNAEIRNTEIKCAKWTKWYELWVVGMTHHGAKRAACESGNYAIVLASETDRCTERKNILALSFLLEGEQIVRLREEEWMFGKTDRVRDESAR